MSDLLMEVASAKTGLEAFDRLSKSFVVSDFKSDVGYVKEQNGKFIALESGTNKPIGEDGGLVSAYSPTLYATKEEAQNAIKAREERNKNYQPAQSKTEEEKQAEKNAKQKAREDKLQADREHTVELIGSLQFPDGYSAKKFEQVRSGTGGEITDVFVQVVGKYDDDLHKRIKKAGGWWDGTTGGNTKTWLIPIEKADLLEKVFKNTQKAKDKAAIAKEKEKQEAIEREIQARKLEQERKEQERLLGEELRQKYNIKGKFGEKITVSQRSDGYIVSFPYDGYLVNRIRTIAGKENYLPDSKAWRVPYVKSQELNDFLTEYEKTYQDRKAQKEAEEQRLKEEAQQRANEVVVPVSDATIEQNNDSDTITFTEIYGDQYRVPDIGSVIIRNGFKYTITDIKAKKMTQAEIDWEEEAGQSGEWDYGAVKATITVKKVNEEELKDKREAESQQRVLDLDKMVKSNDNNSFTPKVSFSGDTVNFSGIVLLYQQSDGNWTACGKRTNDFLDRCVKYNAGIETRYDAVKAMLGGKKQLRNDSQDWYSNCKLTTDSPISLSFKVKDRSGQVSNNPQELFDKSKESYHDYIDVACEVLAKGSYMFGKVEIVR